VLSCWAGVALVAGCADSPAPPARITFSANGRGVVVSPFLRCDAQLTQCTRDESAVGFLPVPPGAAVDVSVPDEVAATPWSVVIGYRGADGVDRDQTVGTFTDGSQRAVTVRTPAADDILRTVEVKQAGAAAAEDPDGQLQVGTQAVWSLQVQAP